jgi:hypothetical protein
MKSPCCLYIFSLQILLGDLWDHLPLCPAPQIFLFFCVIRVLLEESMRLVRQKNMVTSLAGLETKNYFAGEDQ